MANTLPSLGPITETLSPVALSQLQKTLKNWNSLFKCSSTLIGHKTLGTIVDEAQRDQVIAWILANAVLPATDPDDPLKVSLVSLKSLKLSKNDVDRIRAFITPLIDIEDHVLTLYWKDKKGEEANTLTIVNASGIKYDSVLTHVVLPAERAIEPTSADTDGIWYRMGWVWQDEFDEMTRGEIKITLTVDCDENGKAIRCRKFEHSFMQLGDADTSLIPDPPTPNDRNCCEATCAWGWVAGPFDVSIKVDADGLKVEISGSFSSRGKGSKTLVDCCPKVERPREEKPPAEEIKPPPSPTTTSTTTTSGGTTTTTTTSGGGTTTTTSSTGGTTTTTTTTPTNSGGATTTTTTTCGGSATTTTTTTPGGGPHITCTGSALGVGALMRFTIPICEEITLYVHPHEFASLTVKHLGFRGPDPNAEVKLEITHNGTRRVLSPGEEARVVGKDIVVHARGPRGYEAFIEVKRNF